MIKYIKIGVWVVETGCKYDNCTDVEIYATYNNQAAAEAHGAIIEEVLERDHHTATEVRVYEHRIPVARFVTVPLLDADGRVRLADNEEEEK